MLRLGECRFYLTLDVIPARTKAFIRRHLDDEELDSGDDEGRADRVGDEVEEPQMVARERQIQETDLPRMPVPQPSDGEVCLLHNNCLGRC